LSINLFPCISAWYPENGDALGCKRNGTLDDMGALGHDMCGKAIIDREEGDRRS